MRKYILIVVIVGLFLLLTPLVACAEIIESGVCGGRYNEDNVTWSIDDKNVLTISGTGSMQDFPVSITTSMPNTPWIKYSVKKIIIADGITTIGKHSFSHLSSLESVIIPNSVTTIEFGAFGNCKKLTSITIPDSVVTIEDDAFEYSGLKSITIPSNVSYIGSFAFYNCVDLTEVTLPDNLKTIHRFSFSGCKSLKSISIPNLVTWIGEKAFQGCSNLKEIVIPELVTTIQEAAFDSNTMIFCEPGSYAEKYAKAYNYKVHAGHTLTKVDEKEATTTETGIEAYWKCSVCDKLFSDEDGKNEIEAPVEIPVLPGIPLGTNGWVQNTDGTWSYGDTNGFALEGIQNISRVLYCFNDQGKMLTGWIQLDNKWYYAQSSGALYNSGWMDVSGTWYYFKSNGEMATGWINDGGTYYFMNDSGTMATGWVKDGKDWYYMSDSGAMYTGWLKSGGSWYLLKPNGAMAKGWVSDSGTWYYFTSSGIMKTGWFEDKEAEAKLPEGQKRALWYWFDNSGNLAKGWKEINGQWEMFADSGEWLYTWDGN